MVFAGGVTIVGDPDRKCVSVLFAIHICDRIDNLLLQIKKNDSGSYSG